MPTVVAFGIVLAALVLASPASGQGSTPMLSTACGHAPQ
jgi:hypothetical protein